VKSEDKKALLCDSNALQGGGGKTVGPQRGQKGGGAAGPRRAQNTESRLLVLKNRDQMTGSNVGQNKHSSRGKATNLGNRRERWTLKRRTRKLLGVVRKRTTTHEPRQGGTSADCWETLKKRSTARQGGRESVQKTTTRRLREYVAGLGGREEEGAFHCRSPKERLPARENEAEKKSLNGGRVSVEYSKHERCRFGIGGTELRNVKWGGELIAVLPKTEKARFKIEKHFRETFEGKKQFHCMPSQGAARKVLIGGKNRSADSREERR